MEKIAIVYASTHHGSTKKLVDAISDKYGITQIDATTQEKADLSQYDMIGFASGIDFGKFYTSVEEFLVNNLPKSKKVFFLYTCAKTSDRCTKSAKEKAIEKDAVLMGEYGCKGYNTYGPWKLIGGMNKNHPNKDDLEGAVQFFDSIVN